MYLAGKPCKDPFSPLLELTVVTKALRLTIKICMLPVAVW